MVLNIGDYRCDYGYSSTCKISINIVNFEGCTKRERYKRASTNSPTNSSVFVSF